MATTRDVIFRVGSKMGPGGLASLKAGLDMLSAMGKAVAEDIKGLDRFAQAWQRTNQQAVMMADSAAKGIIDTGKIIEGYNKLTQAGAKISDEQFRILTARAVDLSRAVGEDATEAFDRLTTGIAKGSVRALSMYGFKLKESSNLQELQTEAIKKMTDGYGDLNIKAATVSERLYSLNNDIDTAMGLMWEASGTSEKFSDALDGLSGAIGQFNTMLAESPNVMMDFIFSAKGITAYMVEIADNILWLISLIPGLDTGINKQRKMLTDIASGIWEENYIKRAQERQQRKESGIGTGTNIPRTTAPGKGGKKKSAKDEYSFYEGVQASVDERIAAMEMAREANEEWIESVEEAAKKEKEAYDASATGRLAWLENETNVAAYKQELHDQELVRIQEEQIMREEMGARQLTEMEKMLGAEARYGDASAKMWKTGWTAKASILGGVLTDLGVLMHSKSRAMFQIGKAAAISGTIIETASAAMKAYSSLASIPYVGPALGALAAIAVAAAGAVKVRQIRATQFEGGGDVAAGAIATPSLNATTPTATGTSPSYAPTAQEQKPIEVIIRLKDDTTSQLFEVFARENEKAKVDGRQGFAVERRVAGWG